MGARWCGTAMGGPRPHAVLGGEEDDRRWRRTGSVQAGWAGSGQRGKKKAAGWAFPGLAGWEVCSLFLFLF